MKTPLRPGLFVLALAACGGSGDEQDNSSVMYSTIPEPAGDNCPNGGIQVFSGIDENGNGTLDEEERDETEYVCNGDDGDDGDDGETGANGANGSDGTDVLISTSVEAAGDNCQNGGLRIDSGLDNGDGAGTADDGVLDAEEIDSTEYVCNGANGFATLSTFSPEPVGVNCTTGGTRIDSGLDNGDGDGTADDGVLDDDEIDDSTFVCNGGNGSLESICIDSAGDPGVVLNNVCLLAYDATSTTQWNAAATTCVALGGDLCSPAQYHSLRYDPDTFSDIFYSGRPVWSNDFSDNDNGAKGIILRSADNPAVTSTYSYGCCLNTTPEPYRTQAETINGVIVTYLHDTEDTTFRAASTICHERGSDLCSKSEYVALNDDERFNGTVRVATSELSDNDTGDFDAIVGTNTPDNGSPYNQWAFACCGSTMPLSNECPVPEQINGLCVVDIHDTEDATFFDAARACTAQGADVCSKSQMQTLRNLGQFIGESWTNDGADNDGSSVGGLLGSQPDNPDPAVDTFGYACCL